MKKHFSVELLAVAAFAVGSAIAGYARASAVLILGNGNDANTEAAQTILLAKGQTSVTIGPSISTFDSDGSFDLSGYNAVVLLDGDQTNEGYNMPVTGQNALLSFVNNGGGLITSEWSNWNNINMTTLRVAFPVVQSGNFTYDAALGYTVSTADATLDNGVSSSFSFTADNDGGTNTYLQPLAGATVYFTQQSGAAGDGLIGWNYGSGRVLSFSTLISADATSGSSPGPELTDPDYAQLFNNSVDWVAGSSVPEPASALIYAGLIGMTALTMNRKRSAC